MASRSKNYCGRSMNHNNHSKFKCTVCEGEIEVAAGITEGERVTCPNCFAQLSIRIYDGKKQLRCAICSNPKLLECPVDCERKFSEREKRGFFNIKL